MQLENRRDGQQSSSQSSSVLRHERQASLHHLRMMISRKCSLFATPSKNQESANSNIAEMKVQDIRAELESYGISTKSFFEKREFVEALEKARSEGKVPISSDRTSSTKDSTVKEETRTATGTNNDQTKFNYEEEMQKASTMKVSDLKKELQSMGVSTNTFFEKTEFVKAYVEALQSGKQKGTSSSSQSNQQRSSTSNEKFDPTFRDVVMQKMEKRDPRLVQGTIIDVRIS
jgi:hypothetical protein